MAVALERIENQSNYKKQLEINAGHINPHIKEFSKAFLASRESQIIIQEVNRNREGLSSLHFGLLAYASYQYAILENIDQIETNNITWEEAVELVNSQYADIVKSCLLTKHVNITNPKRYGALAVTTLKIFGRPINVLDVGCGFYPKGIGYPLLDSLPESLDMDSLNYVSKIHKSGYPYKYRHAVDIQKPDPAWSAASIWQPIASLNQTKQELVRALEQNSSEVVFEQLDLTQKIPKTEEKIDLFYLSNISYQLSKKDIKKIISNIKRVANHDAVVVTGGYLKRGSRRIPFTYGLSYVSLNLYFEEQKLQPLYLLDSADCEKIRSVK